MLLYFLLLLHLALYPHFIALKAITLNPTTSFTFELQNVVQPSSEMNVERNLLHHEEADLWYNTQVLSHIFSLDVNAAFDVLSSSLFALYSPTSIG
jgi:hypothetical protein